MRSQSAAVHVVVYLIGLYRHMISPYRLPTCRFTPTCSAYAVDALSEYGFFRGGWLALVRLLKCGPWHNGGWDPIPDRPNHTAVAGSCDVAVCEMADHTRNSPIHRGKSQTSVV